MQKTERRAQYPIEELLLHRWSPRAMSGEKVSQAELMRLFEASRWAPSSYNNQPWRFIYAHRETPEWDVLFNLMVPFNQEWTVRGAVLVVIISANNFAHNGKPARTHSFDAGAAWENLALQGAAMDLVIHGMEGFDYDKARTDLHVPDDHTVEAMCVIGRPGEIKDLSPELQKRETPSVRLPVEKFAFEGGFKSDVGS